MKGRVTLTCRGNLSAVRAQTISTVDFVISDDCMFWVGEIAEEGTPHVRNKNVTVPYQLGTVDIWAQDNATGYGASGVVREKMTHGIYTHLSWV